MFSSVSFYASLYTEITITSPAGPFSRANILTPIFKYLPGCPDSGLGTYTMTHEWDMHTIETQRVVLHIPLQL